jgi:hypothetical protein
VLFFHAPAIARAAARKAARAREARLLRACGGDKEQAAAVKRMMRRPR